MIKASDSTTPRPPHTLSVAELCTRNDISVSQAERALAVLQDKGLVVGFTPGDLHAQITLTDAASRLIY